MKSVTKTYNITAYEAFSSGLTSAQLAGLYRVYSHTSKRYTSLTSMGSSWSSDSITIDNDNGLKLYIEDTENYSVGEIYPADVSGTRKYTWYYFGQSKEMDYPSLLNLF